MQPSGVEAAIHELEKDVKRVQEVIGMLKSIHSQRGASTPGTGTRRRRRLSADARRRISQAAKKRWAAARSSKGQAAKNARA